MFRLAKFADSKSALVNDLAVIDECDSDAGDVELLHRVLDERSELRDPRSIERMGLAPSEGFALVAFRAQAFEDDTDGSVPLLDGGLRAFENHDCPVGSGAICISTHYDSFIGRSLVVKRLAFVPAFARRLRCHQLDRALRIGFVGGPRCGHCRFRVGRLGIDDHDVSVRFGRFENHHVRRRHDGPSGRNDESRAAGSRAWSVSRDALGSGFLLCRRERGQAEKSDGNQQGQIAVGIHPASEHRITSSKFSGTIFMQTFQAL